MVGDNVQYRDESKLNGVMPIWPPLSSVMNLPAGVSIVDEPGRYNAAKAWLPQSLGLRRRSGSQTYML